MQQCVEMLLHVHNYSDTLYMYMYLMLLQLHSPVFCVFAVSLPKKFPGVHFCLVVLLFVLYMRSVVHPPLSKVHCHTFIV